MREISRLYSSQEIARADQRAMTDLSVPSEVLMENAGSLCANYAFSMTSIKDKVVVMAGTGNNGGDGMVVARHLDRMGRSVTVFIAGEVEKTRDATAVNLKILKSLGIPCFEMDSISDNFIKSELDGASLVVDALLGTGASGKPRGQVLRAVEAVSGFSPILSVDGPTGVNLDDGTVPGKAILSDLTVTMVSKKIGHAIFPGKTYSGKVEVAHIGIDPARLLDVEKNAFFSVDENYVASRYPKASFNSDKYSRGGVLVVAGSCDYPGAAALVARGVLRAGAGLCVLAAPEQVRPYLNSLPEVIFQPIKNVNDVPKILDRWSSPCPVTVIGSGLGRSDFSKDLFEAFWLSGLSSVVVDGDGLYFLPKMDLSAVGKVIITPHEGEAARLIGWTRDRVACNRLLAAGSLGGRYGVCLLKGPGSIVTSRERRGVISSGNECLSVAGSGDVLAGAVGAIWSRGTNAFDAAALGGWIHGKAGELLSKRSLDGALASEVADKIPDVLGGVS